MKQYHNSKDLHEGDKFGRLTVICKTDRRDRHGNIFYRCQCECGKVVEVRAAHLTRGSVLSCGCLRDEHAADLGRSHKGVKPSLMQKSYDLGLDTNLGKLTSKKLDKRNTSGHTGVYFDKKSQKWKACLNCHHQAHRLGSFRTYKEAVKAREAAEAEYFDPILEKAGLK